MMCKSFFKKIVGAATVAVVLGVVSCGGDGGGRLITEVSPKDAGTVSRDIMQERYPAGTNVTLTAEAAPGHRFKEWRGAISGNTSTINVATVGNMRVTAVFEKLSKPGPQLTDSRDRKTYRTVVIGDQTWMAENLNFATSSGSWCYDNNTENCNTYGRLYDWNTARTVCPAGWRLPGDGDWGELEYFISGLSPMGDGWTLKSQSGWDNNGNGSDELGFSALPGGQRDTIGGFHRIGSNGYWWSATERGATDAWYRAISSSTSRMTRDRLWRYHYGGEKNYGFSVRCVKD